MDKTTPRRRSVKFAKQKSSEYYTYYKQRSVDDDYLGRVRSKSYREEPTLRKSQSLKIRRTHRPYKVMYKARCKTMIKVTFLPESPGSKTPDFRIDVIGAKETSYSPKGPQKSVRFFIDSSKVHYGVPADIIVKDNDQEHRVTVDNLLDIDKARILQCKTMQMNLTASPPEVKPPDVRTFDNTEGFLCREEAEFQRQRKMYIQIELGKLLNRDIKVNEVPHIALMGSGGGYRAMVAMSGIFNALYDSGILDYVLYTAALSGSSWYISTLYSHPEWPLVHPKTVQENIKANILSDPKSLSNILYYGWDFIKKKLKGKNLNFTTDVFAPLLGNVLIKNRLGSKWSEQANKMKEGIVPLPLLAAIHAKTKEKAKNFHEWVEFSPYEVNIPKYGVAVDMKRFGSEFTGGVLTKENKEIPLYEIMGICGSAFTLTLEELNQKDAVTSQRRITSELDAPKTMTNYKECDDLDGRDSNDTIHLNGSVNIPQHASTQFDQIDGISNDHKQTLHTMKGCGSVVSSPLHVHERERKLPENELGFDVLDGFASTKIQYNSNSVITDDLGFDVLESCGKNIRDNSGMNGTSDLAEDRVQSSEDEDEEYEFTPIKNEPPNKEELEALFLTACQIRENDGHTLQKFETESIVNPVIIDLMKDKRESNISSFDEDVFSNNERHDVGRKNDLSAITNGDDLDGDGFFLPEWIENPFWIENPLKEMFMNDRSNRAAFVNNFLRKLSFDDYPVFAKEAAKNSLFENYLKNDVEKLCLIDAGLAFNSPYPLLFQPGRDIDLIMSFDFTDRNEDSNNPFKTLHEAEKWAEEHGIKFPKIDVEKYDEKDVQELYIFEDEQDPECPTIMHFVLVNKDFRKYTKPGVRRTEQEEKFADFNIYDDQKTFHCTNFQYSEKNFDRLSQLSEFIVLNNVGRIKDCVRKSIRNKQDRSSSSARRRHQSGPM